MRQVSVNQIFQHAQHGNTYANIAAAALIKDGKVASTNLLEIYNKIAKAKNDGCLMARDILALFNRSVALDNILDYPLQQESVNQLNESANIGNIFAMAIIAIIYHRGVVVARNIDMSRMWIEKSIQNGCLWAEDLANEYGFLANNGNSGYDVEINVNGNSVYTGSAFTPNDLSKLEGSSSKPENTSVEKTDYMKELNSLIGLKQVKQDIDSLRNFVKAQRLRGEVGLKSSHVSYHCVFTGNPGTGKTTVARIVAGIYKELGVLRKGHLVEVQRSDLVAEYTGQTAVKTNKKIDEALDGVLFVDEAYTLSQGGDGDFGVEAISTLLKRMEDDRHRLIVILAGYTKEIKEFINSNPGLESRFNRYIHFADYTADELKQIFIYTLNKEQYNITPEAFRKVKNILEEKANNKDSKFGNARYVRNLFEVIIQRWADRVASSNSADPEELSMIISEDIIDI